MAIPQLRVQRMGKRWRIVYDSTRTLAKFNSGEPLDEGGYLDEWEDGRKTVDGQILAQQQMVKVTSGESFEDPEAETIGH